MIGIMTDPTDVEAVERDLHANDPHGGWDPYEVMPVLEALVACGYSIVKLEDSDDGWHTENGCGYSSAGPDEPPPGDGWIRHYRIKAT